MNEFPVYVQNPKVTKEDGAFLLRFSVMNNSGNSLMGHISVEISDSDGNRLALKEGSSILCTGEKLMRRRFELPAYPAPLKVCVKVETVYCTHTCCAVSDFQKAP